MNFNKKTLTLSNLTLKPTIILHCIHFNSISINLTLQIIEK